MAAPLLLLQDISVTFGSAPLLDGAGLVTRSKSGRTVTVRLRPRPMREAMEWLRRYERFWSAGLDRLATYAEDKEAEARRKER